MPRNKSEDKILVNLPRAVAGRLDEFMEGMEFKPTRGVVVSTLLNEALDARGAKTAKRAYRRKDKDGADSDSAGVEA